MEALVENSANKPSRFYCHSCSVEIDRVSSDFTCPHCSEGFIEELPASELTNNIPSSPPAPAEPDPNPNDFINPQAIRLASEIFSNSILSPLLLSTSVPRGPDTDGAVSLGDEGSDAAATGTSSGGGLTAMRVLGRHRNRRRGMQNINNLDNILREILLSVADGAHGGTGGTPLIFMGNPGDYAWGREGLDTIVTQLLNQMDNTGPPPLEKDKIAEIPKVTINSEQVDMKLQCSVCWEDFQIDEVVRKLSCTHVYHESCIIPWLELHGTCPICRKSLAPENQSDERSLAAASSAVANTLRSFYSDAFPSVASQSSSSSIDEGGPSTSSLLDLDLGQPVSSFNSGVGQRNSPQSRAPGSSSMNSNAQHQSSSSLARGGNPPPSTSSSNSTANAHGGESSSGSAGGGSSGTSRYRDDDGNIDYEFD